jgi:hypothetical protein
MFDPTKPLALSNSGANTFNECEFKGFLQYIAKAPKDSDYQDPRYFAFGSAFHHILEWCNHDHKKFNAELVKSALLKESLAWENEGAKIMAMLRSYFAMHLKAPLELVGAEIWFENDLVRGKVDAVFVDPAGGWWISDIKTTGQPLSPTKHVELINDQQMNLYGVFGDLLAQKLGLAPENWAGIRYREIEKPRHKYKLGETFEQFHARVAEKGNPPAREIVLTKEQLNWDSVYANFLETVKRARQLQEAYNAGQPVAARQNFQGCKKWGTPCPYWSHCYGSLYSAAKAGSEADVLSFL